jgi:hypothetical protein
VTHVDIAGEPTCAFDVAALLDAFPCLLRLDVEEVELHPQPAKNTSPIPLRHFRETGSDTSDLLRYLLGRSPNLLTAAVLGPLFIAPLASPSGLQELAIDLSFESGTDRLVQFDGLCQFPCLRKLAFRTFCGPVSDVLQPSRPMAKAVRHLAFHNALVLDCLNEIRLLAQESSWLPDLETIFVQSQIG